MAGLVRTRDGEEDEEKLIFSVFWTIGSFSERTVRVARGGFACGQCRAASDAWRVARFSALCLGPDETGR